MMAIVNPEAIVWNPDGTGWTALRIYRDGEEYDTLQLDLSTDRDEWERLADGTLYLNQYRRIAPWTEDPTTVEMVTVVEFTP